MMIPLPKLARMYELTEEQTMLREVVRDYVDEKIVPNREALDKARVYPRQIHDDLLELGIQGMSIPEEYGGLGMTCFDSALVYEELGRGCAGVATGIGANLLGTEPFLFYGTEEQKAKYLPKIAEGAIAAYAITEPDAGSDVGGMSTVAKPSADGKTWTLKGQKTYITNGGIASIYTIFALTDPTRGPRGVSCFIAEVDPENLPPGIEFPPKFDKMGINASETREIIFDGFEVKTEDLVGGKLGRGFMQAMGVFDTSRPMIGTIGVGLAQSAFDAALEYAHQRLQFGRKIIEFSGLRQMFVDMWLKIEGARAIVYGGSKRVDRKFHHGSKEDVTAWAAMAKFMGSESSRVTLDALQATGGYGYMNETPFPKMVRDQKVFEIFEGTNQIQRDQTGKQFGQAYAKTGSAIPFDAQESFDGGRGFGGEFAEMAWSLVDLTMEQVFHTPEGAPSLNDRQEVHWILGEMCGLAESSRFLAEACARSGDETGSVIHALGQAYARQALLDCAQRAEIVLRGIRPEAHAPVASFLDEARTAANGLYDYRDVLGQHLLEADLG
ncbi:MAG: acyl-CoA dehydrogenase family protein [Planctomycetes bacterium]|nr:acyl-CoA dehydrogenase family protein [Planctomycetota bacterium]